MTDGIIQEVFEEMISYNWFVLKNGNIVISVKAVRLLQKELIKKIKLQSQLSDIGTVIRIKKLIGDNE